jgi:hypothetical protein
VEKPLLWVADRFGFPAASPCFACRPLLDGPSDPEHLAEFLREIVPVILALNDGLKLVEIAINSPLLGVAHLKNPDNLEIDMILALLQLVQSPVVLLDEFELVDDGDDFGEVEGADLFEVGEVEGGDLGVVEVGVVVEVDRLGLDEFDQQQAVVVVAETAQLGGTAHLGRQRLPFPHPAQRLRLPQFGKGLQYKFLDVPPAVFGWEEEELNN